MNRIRQLFDIAPVNTTGARRFTLYTSLSTYNATTGLAGSDKVQDGQLAVNSTVYSAILTAMPAYYNNLGSSSINGSASYFSVLDIAEKVGSGLGSYGNPRYWILVQGEGPVMSHRTP